MRTKTFAVVAAAALLTAGLYPATTATAGSAPPTPGPRAQGKVSAQALAQETAARKAQDSVIKESERLAVADRTGNKALDISASSIAAMAKVQARLGASTAKVGAQAAVGASSTPHYYGPYANYANSPQHLPTALVTFAAPPVGAGARTAQGTAVVTDAGVITGVTVTDPGAGYSTAPRVTITSIGAGSGATATATLTTSVGSLTLTNPGSGYNDPVTVTLTVPTTGGDGGGATTGKGAAATATLNSHGVVTALTVTNQGSGYTTAPTVAITDVVGAYSPKATATAVLTKSVLSVTITKGGTGYITPGLRKFVDTLPVPGSVGVNGTATVTKNDLGQYMPIAIPDTTTYPGSDYYEIAVVQYRERMHADLPASGTLLRGYVQLSTSVVPGKHVRLYNAQLDPASAPVAINLPDGSPAYAVDTPHYLGPVVNATKNRPVRVLFRDLLPGGVGGDLFLPVDTTVMGSGAGPNGSDGSVANGGIGADMQNPDCGTTPKPAWCYTENRATIHLHGGVTPWISDGTPHQWITPAGESTDYPAGVSVKNVPDMPDPGAGAQTFFYTNQQSARLLWFHDHSWGITRLNVYAGEAGIYNITDDTEKSLISTATIPNAASTLPLVFEDKTFVPTTAELSVSDPTWDTAQWGGTGNLWVPHVYMTAQNAQDSSGVNQFGRWMYGPWFWPPTNDIQVGLIDNPYAGQCITGTDWCEPTEWAKNPGVPNESMGMEAFNDTPMVNGTAYPTLTVDPKAYRFKILNAANDRMWNLQLYKASGKNNTEVALKAADVAAAKTDPNIEAQPDTTISTPGPSWIQIGTEGGFLPTPAVLPPTPIGYITDPTVFDFGNINRHSLLLGPAERADVVVDFSQFAGQTLIVYNDAPAAAPARDPRYDYYTDDGDLTSTGGAHVTPEGYGPNTRTVMQIKVAAKTPAQAFNMTKLNRAFESTTLGGGGVFESSQHPILVGQGVYDQAYGTSFGSSANDGLVRMTENSLTFNTLTNASATQPGDVVTMNTTSVAMHDEMGAAYDKIYGRMSGSMGVEAPALQPGQAQNLTLYPYVNPPTEVFAGDVLPPGDTAVRIATPSEYDSSIQMWKITHNGVDSHPIHFHLADVQLVNRVSWDGIIRLADPNELGWKDTVRVNPLSDTIVAIRPIIPQSPFGIDVSRRSPNPSMPVGMSDGFNQIDPAGNPYSPAITNQVTDYGWEYVWHCHILSHEEMDMMRPIKVTVPATVPDISTLRFTKTGGLTLYWTDPTPASADGSINASWGDPKNEIGFKIQRALVNTDGTAGTFTEIGTALANHTSFNDPQGGGATPYFYRVVGWNAAGTIDTTAVPTVDPAGAPTGVAGAPAVNSVNVVWVAPLVVAPGMVAGASVKRVTTQDVHTSPILGYSVQYSSDNGATWSTFTADTGSVDTALSVTGLTSHVPYVFRVAAIHEEGMDNWSLTSAAVIPQTAPAQTTSVVGTAGNALASLSWTAPANGGLAITGYAVEYTTNGGTTWTDATPFTGSTATSYTVHGLTNGLAYQFHVAAKNSAGTGAWSTASAGVTPRTVPSAPSRVAATVAGVRILAVTWTAPTSTGGSAITGQRIESSTNGGLSWIVSVRTASPALRRVVFSGLSLSKAYRFRVSAINSAGVGPASAASIAVRPATVAGAPTGVVARASGRRGVVLSWTAPSNGGSAITGYAIDYTVTNGASWARYTSSTASSRTTRTIASLPLGHSYRFRIRAVNAAGTGVSSRASAAIRR